MEDLDTRRILVAVREVFTQLNVLEVCKFLSLCSLNINYNTRCLQMNGAVSKVNKKFISHLTRAKRTPSAAPAVHVSHALPAVRSLVLTAGLRG